MKEALLYEKREKGKVLCRLCRHECLIPEGKRGICFVRENREGTLYSLNYPRIVASHVDPIEKKPLFHFFPGTRSFSIASAGCNFRCGHCQNYQIAQFPRDNRGQIPGRYTAPEEMVEAALDSGCKSISYTYTEPTIYFELALETARLAASRGLKNVFVSNGYMGEEALRTIAPVLDGINVDLKAFSETHYKKICGAKLQPVLDNIRLIASLDIWMEITTLVIPGHNDSEDELKSIAGFIASVDKGIPWHVSRFHPAYKMLDIDITPVSTLMRAVDIGAEAGLDFVYTGNIPGNGGEDTKCPSCGNAVIRRYGYTIEQSRLDNGVCSGCGTKLPGVWE